MEKILASLAIKKSPLKNIKPPRMQIQLPGGILVTTAKLESDYTLVGKIRTAHGLKGEVFVVFNAKKADWLGSVSTLLLLKETESDHGDKMPILHELKINRVKPHKVGAIFMLTGIEDRNQSEALQGTLIYIPNHVLISKESDTVYLKEILGFKVIDETLGDVGVVTGFSSNGPQDILIIRTEKNGDREVPFVPELTKKIKMKAKEILMDLPEGLISET